MPIRFRMQQKNGSCRFPYMYIYIDTAVYKDIYIQIKIYIYLYIYKHINIYICIRYTNIYVFIYVYIYTAISNRKRKTEGQAIFFNPFTVCLSCKRKFVICPFVYEETHASYPFANELNGLNGLA